MFFTAAELGELRADAEELMVDRCVILRPVGTGVDPDTGAEVEEFATLLLDQKCALQMTSDAGIQREAGEQTITLSRIELKLPYTVDFLQVGDRVAMTASVDSPGLVARQLRIEGPWLQSTSVQCRYPCLESTIPEA